MRINGSDPCSSCLTRSAESKVTSVLITLYITTKYLKINKIEPLVFYTFQDNWSKNVNILVHGPKKLTLTTYSQ